MEAPNEELANLLSEIAQYYEIEKNVYRANAYSNASKNVLLYRKKIKSSVQAHNNINGIGESITEDIKQYLKTGKIKRLEELRSKADKIKGDADNRNRIMEFYQSIFGVGVVKALELYNNGYVDTEESLEEAYDNGEFNDMQMKGIKWMYMSKLRIPYRSMIAIEKLIRDKFDEVGIYNQWEMVGSYRRKSPSSGDIDIIMVQDNISMTEVVNGLGDYIVESYSKGAKKFMGIFRKGPKYNGRRIDIRLVDVDKWPIFLLHSTGSEEFNVKMRSRAIFLGLKLNEYELTKQNGKAIPIRSEKDVFDKLGVKYIPPEERTSNVELEIIE